MSNEGEIYNRPRCSQIISFSGIRVGNCSPSDIDGIIETRGKFFIFELKHRGAAMPAGQRIMLARLCDKLEAAGMSAIVAVVSHDTPIGQDIIAADGLVVEYRWKGAWIIPDKQEKLSRAIELFFNASEE